MPDNGNQTSAPMRTLTVKNFSVIKEAKLEFGKITVLIGPQSSGKSLLCKLGFFSYETLNIALRSLDDGKTYEAFLQRASEDFAKLFPNESWGSRRFRIHYRKTVFFSVEIIRKRYKREPRDKASISLPGWFSDLYKSTLQKMTAKRQRGKERDPMALFHLRREFGHSVNAKIGRAGSGSQLFIPAGRSFFTSVGKALAAFEESGSIDPLTLRFGHQIRWDYHDFEYFFARTKKARDVAERLRAEARVLMGGSVKRERKDHFSC